MAGSAMRAVEVPDPQPLHSSLAAARECLTGGAPSHTRCMLRSVLRSNRPAAV